MNTKLRPVGEDYIQATNCCNFYSKSVYKQLANQHLENDVRRHAQPARLRFRLEIRKLRGASSIDEVLGAALLRNGASPGLGENR